MHPNCFLFRGAGALVPRMPMSRYCVSFVNAIVVKSLPAPLTSEIEVIEMNLPVRVQISFAFECFRAHVAGEVSSIRMRDHVLHQQRLGQAAKVALRASLQIGAGVQTHVPWQIIGIGQRLVTNATLDRQLCRSVHAVDVVLKLRFAEILLAACLAPIERAQMNVLMRPQRVEMPEHFWARIAAERTLGAVRVHVRMQLALQPETATAFGALEILVVRVDVMISRLLIAEHLAANQTNAILAGALDRVLD